PSYGLAADGHNQGAAPIRHGAIVGMADCRIEIDSVSRSRARPSAQSFSRPERPFRARLTHSVLKQRSSAMNTGSRLLALVAFVGVCLAVGALGSVLTSSSVETWYPQLRKPALTPPSWAFP